MKESSSRSRHQVHILRAPHHGHRMHYHHQEAHVFFFLSVFGYFNICHGLPFHASTGSIFFANFRGHSIRDDLFALFGRICRNRLEPSKSALPLDQLVGSSDGPSSEAWGNYDDRSDPHCPSLSSCGGEAGKRCPGQTNIPLVHWKFSQTSPLCC